VGRTPERAGAIRGMRHDLRNALTSLAATREMLHRFGDDLSAEEASHFRDVVDRECTRVGALLGRAAGLEIRSARSSVAEVARDVLEVERAALEASSIRSSIDVDPRAEQLGSLLGADDLARVLRNLVVNAREALSGRGRGHIGITVEARGDDELVIRVEDDGPGLLHVDARSIFEPGISSGKEPGRGQGLAIVRALVEGVGGDARAWTRASGGAAFEIRMRARNLE
jgi:two-component system C4-dicarboxylate transport sensor histidine kinase DctB